MLPTPVASVTSIESGMLNDSVAGRARTRLKIRIAELPSPAVGVFVFFATAAGGGSYRSRVSIANLS